MVDKKHFFNNKQTSLEKGFKPRLLLIKIRLLFIELSDYTVLGSSNFMKEPAFTILIKHNKRQVFNINLVSDNIIKSTWIQQYLANV